MRRMADTIVGIATAAGESGIAIVRMSGDNAEDIFNAAFKPQGALTPPYESHRLMYGHIADGEDILDEAMGVIMRAPRSYTRETVCELHTHGGAAASAMTMRLLARLGARPAEPGEFTRRAFMNGRIDLMQAEAVMGVIAASSAAALKASERQLSGGQSRFIAEAQARLIGLLSGLEAHIDFPDEIGEEEATGELRSGLSELIGTLDGAIDERGARILREGLRVALCGRPNAGKSTLFNVLLGEERAIVTDVPGTTRDVLEGAFTLDGYTVRLFDTAGLRQSDDIVEKIGVERAMKALGEADAALVLVDASREPDAEEEALLREPLSCPRAVLLNKEDAGELFTEREARRICPDAPIFRVSARTLSGLQAVRDYLRGLACLAKPPTLTQERHLSAARQALERLRQAASALEGGAPLDIAAVDMREALFLLGRITGESVDEALLDEIFSKFCVGK